MSRDVTTVPVLFPPRKLPSRSEQFGSLTGAALLHLALPHSSLYFSLRWDNLFRTKYVSQLKKKEHPLSLGVFLLLVQKSAMWAQLAHANFAVHVVAVQTCCCSLVQSCSTELLPHHHPHLTPHWQDPDFCCWPIRSRTGLFGS